MSKTKKRKVKPPPKPLTANNNRSEQKTKAIFRGFLRYIQRPGATIAKIWASEKLDDKEESPYIREVISEDAFLKQAIVANWRIRREEHWTEIQDKVLNHLQTEAVKSEVEEISQLEALKQLTIDHITGDEGRDIKPVKPRSLEGAIGAYISIDKRISTKRGFIADQTSKSALDSNDMGNVTGTGQINLALPEVGLSEEDIASMAKILTSSRAGLSNEETSNINLPKTVDIQAVDLEGERNEVINGEDEERDHSTVEGKRETTETSQETL